MSQLLHLKNGILLILSKLLWGNRREDNLKNLAYSSRHSRRLCWIQPDSKDRRGKVKYYILIAKSISQFEKPARTLKHKMTLNLCREFSKYFKDI